ncbi:MAG: FAD-dependent oxidoreductase, partial [Alphaproteobacteria bacterium]
MAQPRSETCDAEVLVVGAGMVGLSLACALAGAGVAVAAIDREDPAALTDEGFDGRVSAIAHGSQQALAAIGLWPALCADAQPILEIRVSDGDSPLFLHYDHADVGDAPLGFIVENRHIRQALFAAAARLDRLRLIAPV